MGRGFGRWTGPGGSLPAVATVAIVAAIEIEIGILIVERSGGDSACCAL